MTEMLEWACKCQGCAATFKVVGASARFICDGCQAKIDGYSEAYDRGLNDFTKSLDTLPPEAQHTKMLHAAAKSLRKSNMLREDLAGAVKILKAELQIWKDRYGAVHRDNKNLEKKAQVLGEDNTRVRTELYELVAKTCGVDLGGLPTPRQLRVKEGVSPIESAVGGTLRPPYKKDPDVQDN